MKSSNFPTVNGTIYNSKFEKLGFFDCQNDNRESIIEAAKKAFPNMGWDVIEARFKSYTTQVFKSGKTLRVSN